MPNKSTQENYFVAQVLRQQPATDAAEAAIWFRQRKAWRLSIGQALCAYREARSDSPHPLRMPVAPPSGAALWQGRISVNDTLLQARAALRLLCAAFDTPENRDHATRPDAAEALAAAELVLRSPVRKTHH
jgi:hypothetical protein